MRFKKFSLGLFISASLIACLPTNNEESDIPDDQNVVVDSLGNIDSTDLMDGLSSTLDPMSSEVLSSGVILSSQGQLSSSSNAVSSEALSSEAVVNVPCYPAFASQNGAGYQYGSEVSYQGANYRAISWASDNVTPNQNTGFELVGACGAGVVLSSQVEVSSSQMSSSVQVSSSTVVSSSAAVSSSSVVNVPGSVAGWFTEDMYNKIFPNRAAFYTWSSFVEAFNALQNINGYRQAPTYAEDGTFKKFLQEGTLEQKKREAAAFFANIVQETGRGSWNTALYHRVETCANDGGNPPGPGTVRGHCATDYRTQNNIWGGPVSGKYYYGRGPMQLSWNTNYAWFSQDAFGDQNVLKNNPDLVGNDAKTAWLAAMWFWNRREYWAPQGQAWGAPANPTLHEIMVNNRSYNNNSGFGGTIKAINGALECPTNDKARARGEYFKSIQAEMGISVVSTNLTCF